MEEGPERAHQLGSPDSPAIVSNPEAKIEHHQTPNDESDETGEKDEAP